jgi:hypothetical protein
LGEKLAAAFARKEAIQHKIIRADNSEQDDFPEILARSRCIDRWKHMECWRDQDYGVRNRGYAGIGTYFLFPLLLIEKVVHVEMLRMLPLGRTHYATVRELLAAKIENEQLFHKLLVRGRYRVVALGGDDFNQWGSSPAFIRSVGASIILDRMHDAAGEYWTPKDLFLLRYPNRSS